MSKTKKVNVRLQEGEGYIVLAEEDFVNLTKLFDILSDVETRQDYSQGWSDAADRFTAALNTVHRVEDDEEWD